MAVSGSVTGTKLSDECIAKTTLIEGSRYPTYTKKRDTRTIKKTLIEGSSRC